MPHHLLLVIRRQQRYW